MNPSEDFSSFGQADPTDGKKLGDWKSTYDDPVPKKAIKLEAIYLGLLLFTIPIIMIIFWLELPKSWFHLCDVRSKTLVKYALAWTSGTLGGTLFAIKWLYHVVGRKLWHLDRRLWRFFTPHISGCLAFGVTALVSSGVINIFDRKSMDNYPMLVGFGFLVGYFSDSASAKLSEVADTLFGTSRSKEKHKEALGSGGGHVPKEP